MNDHKPYHADGSASRHLLTALTLARTYVAAGLRQRPFDAIFVHARDQLAIVERELQRGGSLGGLRSGEIDVGRMAARELGSEEAEFAHALHIIQDAVDVATGDNAENRRMLR